MNKVTHILFLIALVCSTRVFATDINIAKPRCEMLSNPMGIDSKHPRFSWQLQSSERGVMQLNYQILVASTPEKLARNEADLWNSGKISSDKSILISYNGRPLTSRQTCFWKVKG